MAQIETQVNHASNSLASSESNNDEPASDGASPVDSQFEAQAVMQASFDKVVSKELGTPFGYLNVAVLIIRWADYLDRHLKCGGEVLQLNDLFVERFRFKSEILVLDDKKNPQLQLNRGVTNFVYENDGSCRTNLLIVYYTGHGIHSEEEGLDITGVRETGHPPIPPSYDPRANWNQAEQSLRLAEADVLTILDTCSAGSVIKGVGDDFKVFEVLAATARKSVTAGPGPRSFTKALIDSLEAQLNEYKGEPFTTYDLNQAIMRRRKNQNSHLFPRFARRSGRFIKLAPVGAAPMERESKQNGLINSGDCSHLTLRFVLGISIPLSPEQAEGLATRLSRAAVESKVDIRTIEWVNYRPKKEGERFAEFASLYRTIKEVERRWKALVHKKNLKRSRAELEDEDETPPKCSRRFAGPMSSSSGESFEMLSPSPSVRSYTGSPY